MFRKKEKKKINNNNLGADILDTISKCLTLWWNIGLLKMAAKVKHWPAEVNSGSATEFVFSPRIDISTPF